jgi:hypothetical protein
MLDVPDSPANQAAFLASRNTRGRGAFPKVRLLQLIECGTDAVIDAAFGAVSEQVLARRVPGSLGAGMLLLGDRNFPSYQRAIPLHQYTLASLERVLGDDHPCTRTSRHNLNLAYQAGGLSDAAGTPAETRALVLTLPPPRDFMR